MIRKNRNKFIAGRAANPKIGIVVSGYHEDVTSSLRKGAVRALLENSVSIKNIDIVDVPGSFEIPLALRRMAGSNKYDALIGIGCVIKGETDHYYFISSEVSQGIMRVMLDYQIPIGFGLVTTNTLKQAEARSKGNNNKGAEAARAALAMILPAKNYPIGEK